jgi:hypothetical protein
VWDELVARYRWADEADDENLHALTIAMVSGAKEDEVIRAFGGDSDSSRSMPFPEVLDEAFGGYPEVPGLLQVLSVGDLVVTLEGGYRGSVPEVARRASAAGGAFFSISWDVNGGLQVMYALKGGVDGVLEDPSWIEDAPYMDADECPEIPAWAEGAPFTLETARSVSFAVMERTMGQGFDQSWLEIPLRTVRLSPIEAVFPDLDAAYRH